MSVKIVVVNRLMAFSAAFRVLQLAFTSIHLRVTFRLIYRRSRAELVYQAVRRGSDLNAAVEGSRAVS